ncbi:MAG: glycosyltransferase [Planctomycetes bacterium]|nr:glycosyltransferase [Planctomycetota bacterium]
MPRPAELAVLGMAPGLGRWRERVARRAFAPLQDAPLIEGRLGEWGRMVQRVLMPKADEGRFARQANQWLMRTMAKHARHRAVTAVHAYEDCSLAQFEVARQLGKACIYDLPIGYTEAWQQRRAQLLNEYAPWVGREANEIDSVVSLEQKQREMRLADLVLAPSAFVADSIKPFHDKTVAVARYGVDSQFWSPRPSDIPRRSGPLRFMYAGHMSIRKGVPLLLRAWSAASIADAELQLVGNWRLAERARADLPTGVVYSGPCSREELRDRFQQADVFVFPSFFEGAALVVAEALATGLPVLASDASGYAEVIGNEFGLVFPAGNLEALVVALRRLSDCRDQLPAMAVSALKAAEQLTWGSYRRSVSAAVDTLGVA